MVGTQYSEASWIDAALLGCEMTRMARAVEQDRSNDDFMVTSVIDERHLRLNGVTKQHCR
jgi:hypothetical protein